MATQNWWDQFPTAPDSAPAGPITSPQETISPVDQRRLENEERRLVLAEGSAERDRKKDEREEAERQRALEAQERGISDSIAELRSVISAATEAKKRSHDWFATGFGAETARNIGGTPAADVEGLLTTIGANTAFDRLQRMREESPTGGALGQVAVPELEMLRDSVASLRQSQSDRQFRSNMDKVIESYQRVLDRLEGAEESGATADGDGEWTAEQSAEFWGRPLFNEDGTPLGPDGGYAYDEEGNEVGLMARISDDSKPENEPPPENEAGFFSGDYSPSSLARGLGQGAGSIVEGVGDIAGIVTNPIGQLLYDALGHDERYDTGTILREATGLPDNPNPVNDAVTRGATAALSGAGLARAASTLTNPGLVQNVLGVVGRTPIRDAAAGAGAGAGMVAAEETGIPGAGLAGAVLGGMAGYKGANTVAQAVLPRQPNSLIQAADDLKVQMLPGDVGGHGTRMATGAVGSTLGGIPLAEGAQASIASAGRATRSAANKIGDVTDPTGAGQDVARGFQKFDKGSAARAQQLYENIPVPPDAKVKLDSTRSALLDVTEGFASNPELSRIWADHPRLRATLEALAPKDVVKRDVRGGMEVTRRVQPEGGELSWQDMKRFRTIVGEIVGQPGVTADGSDIAGLRKLYGALSRDMEATAAATSPRALQEFERANRYWRGRQARIDDVFATLLGPDGKRAPEKVFRQINNWAKSEGGDFNRLARTIRSLPKDEADTVRATIVQRMGLATPRNQEGAGEVFSPKEFSAQWQGMSPRAKAVLFPNKSHRENLDKLATIMDGMKQADQFANYSRTALGVNAVTQGALALSSFPIAAALGGLQLAAGKVLSSPRLARWLASAPKTDNPAALRRWSEDLGVIAGREPLLATDIRAIQQNLAQAFGQSPGRLAASEQERDRGPKPPEKPER